MCSYWCPVSIYDIVKFILACDNITQKESGRYRITQSKTSIANTSDYINLSQIKHP